MNYNNKPTYRCLTSTTPANNGDSTELVKVLREIALEDIKSMKMRPHQ